MTQDKCLLISGAIVKNAQAFSVLPDGLADLMIQETGTLIVSWIDYVQRNFKLGAARAAFTTPPCKGFKVKEKFFDHPGLAVSLIGSGFKELFYNKEEDFSGSIIFFRDLLGNASDQEIRANLEIEVTSIVDVHSALLMQPNGETGHLLVNGADNIFFCLDAGDQLRVVRIFWDKVRQGWEIDALPLNNPHGWDEADRVFYPVSL